MQPCPDSGGLQISSLAVAFRKRDKVRWRRFVPATTLRLCRTQVQSRTTLLPPMHLLMLQKVFAMSQAWNAL